MSTQDYKVELTESFRAWRQKYNALLDEPLIGLFPIDLDNGSLTFNVGGGNIRKGREVLSITDATGLTFNANEANQYVVLQADIDFTTATITVYSEVNLPAEETFNIVPLYKIETDIDSVINFEDLRAVYNFGGGSGGTVNESSSILKFDKNITEDTTIDATQNALSVDPTVAQGVTVTVDQDSVWVIL